MRKTKAKKGDKGKNAGGQPHALILKAKRKSPCSQEEYTAKMNRIARKRSREERPGMGTDAREGGEVRPCRWKGPDGKYVGAEG